MAKLDGDRVHPKGLKRDRKITIKMADFLLGEHFLIFMLIRLSLH